MSGLTVSTKSNKNKANGCRGGFIPGIPGVSKCEEPCYIDDLCEKHYNEVKEIKEKMAQEKKAEEERKAQEKKAEEERKAYLQHRYSEDTPVFPVMEDDRLIGWESKLDVDESLASKIFITRNTREDGFCLIQRDGDTLCIFNDKTGKWDTGEHAVKKAIYNSNLKIWRLTKDDTNCWIQSKTAINYSGKVNNVELVYKALCFEIEDTQFINRNIESNIGKLLFEDGIYDFYTNTFTEGFDPKIVFFHQIPRKFNAIRDDDKISWVKKILFDDLFDNKDSADFMLASIARALYGDYKVRKAPFCMGPTASGKGLLSGAIENAFPGYTSQFNANNFLYRKSNNDEALKFQWVESLKTVRLSFSNEIEIDAKISSDIFKKIVSGGDTLNVRGIFGREYCMVNRATLFFLANDFPEFNQKDDAVDDRIEQVHFTYSFKENPNPKYSNEKQRDTTLKSKFSSKEYMEALFWVIADAYQELVKDKKYLDMVQSEEIVEILESSKETFETVFEENFEIGDENTDKVKASDFNIPFAEKLGFSPKKIGMELILFCKAKGINIPSKTSNGTRYRFGIRHKAKEYNLL